MTPQEQSRMQRIARVVESYAQEGIAISCEETDNWAGMPSTQISAMKRRANLPIHYTYKIRILNTGEELTKETS
jgi:hypothetical protein